MYEGCGPSEAVKQDDFGVRAVVFEIPRDTAYATPPNCQCQFKDAWDPCPQRSSRHLEYMLLKHLLLKNLLLKHLDKQELKATLVA